VAGRGILRLKEYDEANASCEAATNVNSPLNGWAWRAIGKHKSNIEDDNDMAAICLQEALRSTDILSPQNESMSKFYSMNTVAESSELSNVWIDLAICYRRLGRYSAAIRAFNSASSTAEEKLPASALVSWAQVQLELGQVDEAAEKFGIALGQNEKSIFSVASFGQGCALLSVAQRDVHDGKAGTAYSTLTKAISVVKDSFGSTDNESKRVLCMMKLLGDMYTFGKMLPPDVFFNEASKLKSLDNLTDVLRSQISFIAKGEKYYRIAEESINVEEESDRTLQAVFACDIGSNLLIQGQLVSAMLGEGQGTRMNLSSFSTLSNTEVRDCLHQSAEAFKRAIKAYPIFAPAWCGLGCAVSASDPLLSQHAFVRAVELDKSLPDSWANLGFLYAERDAFVAASHVMNELTQVADTPMMWICRASILERESFVESNLSLKRQKFFQAADAYKASLQVLKDPDGLLGIGITTGLSDEESDKQEAFNYLCEYVGTTNGRSIGAVLLQKTLSLYDTLKKIKLEPLPWKETTLKEELRCVHQLSEVHQQNWSLLDDAKSEIASVSKKGYIDSELIGQLYTKIEKCETAVGDDFPLSDVQLELVKNPKNGILWLRIAENLAKDLVKMKGIKKKRLVLQTIESATLASSKAARILLEQFSNPTVNKTCSNRMVCAQDVSNSLALAYNIKASQQELLNCIKDPLKPPKPNPYDIQRALIMHPANRLARAVLATECEK